MKNLLIILIVVSVLLGCKKDQKKFIYEFNISNNTGINLNIVNTQISQVFQLKQGNTTIFSDQAIDAFKIEETTFSTKKYTIEKLSEGSYFVNEYDNDLEYRFLGTTEEAKISYLDDQGQRISIAKISLPYQVNYKNFTMKTYNIDSENLQTRGIVTVEVFFKGKRLHQVSSPQRVGAGGNINGGTF